MSTSSSGGPIPPWLDLPPEITAAILQKVGTVEMLTTLPNVCKYWRSVCQAKDLSLWRSINMGTSSASWDSPLDLYGMCCYAVDRSRGQLTHVTLRNFGCDSLLRYISERCSQLKSLRLICPDVIYAKPMIEAFKNFPLLEELHLYDTCIEADTIKAIGRSCPLLKSFKLNCHWMRVADPCDLEALAIAETMPKLQHLQLYKNKMTNSGLQAILDGCPLLESLDLRRCKNVHLSGDLARICSERIKNLRHPDDSTHDYEFGTILSIFEWL